MRNTITKFDGDNSFLSNFASSPIYYEGEWYPTVEHAYQAAKTEDQEWKEKIRKCESPGQAKRWGLRAPIREDWESVKLEIMLELLRLKFEQRGYFAEKLIETHPKKLIEGNTWGDHFWGKVNYRGRWVGENHLGKLLMQVRKELLSD